MKLYILLLVLTIVCIYVFTFKDDDIENFANYASSCGYLPELFQKVVDEQDLDANPEDYEYYFPCSYNSCEKDVLAFENKTGKKIFLIDGCDYIASKLALWSLLKDEYGPKATDYMPATFLLNDKNDLAEFPKYFKDINLQRKSKGHKSDQMYVLKNYAQRQEGIKLTRDLNEILNGMKDGWYLAQEYLYNPFLINKRKTNFRYYLLVICYNNRIKGYIHKDGFVYYTPEFYDPDDIAFDKHITTGYIDRKVYDVNPLTLDDFRDHLDSLGYSSELWNKNVNELMNKVMNAISKKICKNKKLDGNLRFQLFGCDLAPTADLGVKLMEINKGPDLGAKDERDKKIKFGVQKDIFTVIDDVIEGRDVINNTRFVQIF